MKSFITNAAQKITDATQKIGTDGRGQRGSSPNVMGKPLTKISNKGPAKLGDPPGYTGDRDSGQSKNGSVEGRATTEILPYPDVEFNHSVPNTDTDAPALPPKKKDSDKRTMSTNQIQGISLKPVSSKFAKLPAPLLDPQHFEDEGSPGSDSPASQQSEGSRKYKGAGTATPPNFSPIQEYRQGKLPGSLVQVQLTHPVSVESTQHPTFNLEEQEAMLGPETRQALAAVEASLMALNKHLLDLNPSCDQVVTVQQKVCQLVSQSVLAGPVIHGVRPDRPVMLSSLYDNYTSILKAMDARYWPIFDLFLTPGFQDLVAVMDQITVTDAAAASLFRVMELADVTIPLLTKMIEKEVEKTASEGSLFRDTSMLSKCLTKLCREEDKELKYSEKLFSELFLNVPALSETVLDDCTEQDQKSQSMYKTCALFELDPSKVILPKLVLPYDCDKSEESKLLKNLKSGWLMKKGEMRKNWKERYFRIMPPVAVTGLEVYARETQAIKALGSKQNRKEFFNRKEATKFPVWLQDDSYHLRYSAGQFDHNYLGSIVIGPRTRAYECIEANNKVFGKTDMGKYMHALQITGGGKRTYYLCAPSENDMHDWIEAINFYAKKIHSKRSSKDKDPDKGSVSLGGSITKGLEFGTSQDEEDLELDDDDKEDGYDSEGGSDREEGSQIMSSSNLPTVSAASMMVDFKKLEGPGPIDPALAMVEDPNKAHCLMIVDANRQLLEGTVTHILARLAETLDQAPARLRIIAHALVRATAQRFSDQCAQFVVGGFLYLRFICPVILEWPTRITEKQKSKHNTPPKLTVACRRNLLILTKVLQNLANGVFFGAKEQFMLPLNKYVEANIPIQADLFRQFAKPDSLIVPPTSGDLLPAHIRRARRVNRAKTYAEDFEMILEAYTKWQKQDKSSSA